MNQLQIFNHPMFGELPVMIVDGVEWFGATESAKTLGFANQRDAIKNHVDEDDVAVHDVIDKLGRKQSKKFINESGLYSLIIGAAKQGNNPEIKEKAKRFKRWVTAEVLPTIRKTGGYVSNDDLFIQTYLPFADDQTKMLFKGVLETVRKQNEQIAAMKPKAEAHDKFISGENYQSMAVVAKALGTGRNRLYDFLRKQKILMSNNVPYQKYIDRGYFVVKEKSIQMGEQVINKPQTYVTAKGVDFIFRLLQEQTA
jgi:prophage antirepressor-like protein